MNDVLEYTSIVRRAEGKEKLPCFLLGHSMGGLIATRAMQRLAAAAKEEGSHPRDIFGTVLATAS